MSIQLTLVSLGGWCVIPHQLHNVKAKQAKVCQVRLTHYFVEIIFYDFFSEV